MHNVVLTVEEGGTTTLTVDCVVVAQGDIHLVVENPEWRAREAFMTVWLWHDPTDGPQVQLLTRGLDFAAAKEKLIQLRDRLTQEIENGPSMCPFAPKEQEVTQCPEKQARS